MPPQRSRRPILWLVIALCGVAIGGTYLYRLRTHLHAYHLALLKVRGDVAAKRTMELYHVQFTEEQHVVFSREGPADALRPLWAFRPSHAVPTYPVPVVDDTDRDGVPEVYIGSYTRKLYALDGRDGSRLWDWELPFGVVGGVAVELADVDHDGRNEVLFGTHWTLPVRVYALRTARDLEASRRLYWVRNISGDFLESGFNITRDGGQTYVVAATRDAPYSRGSLNATDGRGRLIWRPIKGLDVCANRIAIGRLPDSQRVSIIHGSHQFYGATYGHRITARDLQTGTVLWSTPLPGDTGFQNHQIVDLDFDGQNEVVGMAGNDQFFQLDGATGAIVQRLPGPVAGILKREQLVLMQEPDGVSCYDRRGQRLYQVPPIAFGVRFAEDGALRLVRFAYAGGLLTCDVYHAATGRHEQRFTASMTLPPYDEPSKYGTFGPPGRDGALFRTLADTDGDGYWNALLLCGYTIVNVHLPFRVHPGYEPYALMPYRNTTNEGIVYEPTLSRQQASTAQER